MQYKKPCDHFPKIPLLKERALWRIKKFDEFVGFQLDVNN
jgi:hypothetical protein